MRGGCSKGHRELSGDRASASSDRFKFEKGAADGSSLFISSALCSLPASGCRAKENDHPQRGQQVQLPVLPRCLISFLSTHSNSSLISFRFQSHEGAPDRKSVPFGACATET